jgi:internalin A
LTFIPGEICDLTNLTSIDVAENQLTDLPAEMGRLVHLNSLNVSQNRLSDLPTQIANLTKITFLSIHHNKFSAFPEAITQLSALKELYIGKNPISMIPKGVGKLRELEKLNMVQNALSDLPSEIANLTNITELTISRNRFSYIPDSIYKISSLRFLQANYNQIEKISPLIQNLTNLETLLLEHNQVKQLPGEIRDLTKLTHLNLLENLLQIPLEILEKTDQPSAILDFYFSMAGQKRRPINALKLLIIGQGSVGKTSLIRQILHGRFDPNQIKTEGISINQWTVGSIPSTVTTELTSGIKSQPSIKLNLWDFGGQEIMHATHQFFLTRRSLYLLVLDSRLTQEENRVEYWLKIIQSFGGESPVLIVGNKIDQHPLDLDRTGLQKKYPHIVGILETSAATGAGIEELKAAITEQVNNLPHIHDLLPETWFTVKTKLEGLGRESNFITHDKYLELCLENEVRDETSQHTLLGFLHDLGVVLHFQDDPRLEALGILNPQWVTNGVYKIINSHALFQNNGMLTVSMLDEILNLPGYPRGKRLFIIDMMKKFELCYDIEPDKTFLVPDLLPKDEPMELKFTGIPAFEYAYPVLPSSIVTRFIVRMNQHIHANCVWRTGVLLKIGENGALVKADIEDRKITIAITGLAHTRRDALSAIRYQLDEIHASIKGLDAQRRVPIPNAPNAEPLEYEYLLMLEREGQETHLVKDGARLVKINVREVLSGIESESQRREFGGNVTNIYIGGNVEGSNIVSGNDNVITQRIQSSFKKVEAADIQTELKETLKQLAAAVAVMAKSLPTEQATEATEDLSRLVEEATKPAPKKKWYSVSIEGLIKAAENVEKVGEPVINLSRKVLSLLTGGVIE